MNNDAAVQYEPTPSLQLFKAAYESEFSARHVHQLTSSVLERTLGRSWVKVE
jgi:hypothetical protein